MTQSVFRAPGGAVVQVEDHRKFDEFVTFVIDPDSAPRRYSDTYAAVGRLLPGSGGHAWPMATASQCSREESFSSTATRVVMRFSVRVVDIHPADEPVLSSIVGQFTVAGKPKVSACLDELIEARDVDLEARIAKLETAVAILAGKGSDGEEAIRRLGGSMVAPDPRACVPAVLIRPGEQYEVAFRWDTRLSLRQPIVLRRHLRGIEKVPVA